MALNEQVDKLVGKLTVLSQGGKVDWEETANPSAFQAVVSKFVVTVAFREPTVWSEPDYFELEIRDQQGKFVDGANAASPKTEDWKRLEALHELARRRALHVDEALSDLLAALAVYSNQHLKGSSKISIVS